MNLYSYFKPTNRLPYPRGSSSSDITPEAIYLANKKAEHTLKESAVSKKRRAYTKYPLSSEQKLEGTQSFMILPLCFINKEQTSDIFLGRWPTTPSSTTFIAYLSLSLLFLFDSEVDLLAKGSTNLYRHDSL